MNSVLNPEAPEFHPLLKTAVQDGFVHAHHAIGTSNRFPLGFSHDAYKTYTDFGVVTCQISDNVVLQSNQIVGSELPKVQLRRKEPNCDNTEKIIDVNDSLLDRININIDTITGVNQPCVSFYQNASGRVSSWNNAPVITKITVDGVTFIAAKKVPRPQLSFKDPVDNSHNLWVPKIFDKPNNMKPLSLNILYNADGEAVGYEHPYSVELDCYRPPARFVKPDEGVLEFPPPLDGTQFTLVDTEAKLDQLVEHLRECDEIAVDVEHHSYRSYQGITCLIQITTFTGGDFIIDTLALREHVYKLNDSFTDPKKLKIFHGAENDVKWLQRDFGVYIVGLFDTFQAGKILKLPSLSLKNLLTRYCRIETDKKYQLADWRIRPLPPALIEYARTDTHYLLYMWRVMKQQLLQMAGGRPSQLLCAFEYSRHTSCLTYNKEVMDEVCHMELYTRSKKTLNSQQLSALRMLYKWRDAQAREMDEGPSYLIPNHMLLNLAESLPGDVQGINACCSPMTPFMKTNLLPIHKMILSCRELPVDPPAAEASANDNQMLNASQAQQELTCKVHDLAYLPEASEEQINLEMAWALMDQNLVQMNGVRLDVQPDVAVMAPADANLSAGVVSTLNVDAEMFIPPYYRYKTYRSMAQAKELKGLKDKEAKVTALSQGNELIKTEVLLKLQAQRDLTEAVDKANSSVPEPEPIPAAQPKENDIEKEVDIENEVEIKKEEIKEEQPDETTQEIVATTFKEARAAKKAMQRKRKIEKAAAIQLADDKKKEPQKPTNEEAKVKSFHYKNVNYKKFFSESEKGHKQPKMKLKKS